LAERDGPARARHGVQDHGIGLVTTELCKTAKVDQRYRSRGKCHSVAGLAP
jgi:hypothetical protein